MQTSRRLLKYFKPYWKRILAGVLATILVGLLETLFATGCGILVKGLTTISANLQHQGRIFADIIIGDENIYTMPLVISGKYEALMFIVKFGIVILVLVLVKSIFVYGKEYFMSSVTQKVLRTLRHDIYSHVVYLPMRFFDHVKTGTTMNRIIYDVSNIEFSFSSGVTIVQSLIFTIIFLGYMFYRQWELTLFSCFMLPVSAYVLKYFSSQFRKVNKKITEQLANINAYILEALSSIKIVKSYTREDYERKRFLDKVNQHYYYNMKSVRLTAFLKPINETISLGGMILIIGYAGYRMITGQMDMADLTAFVVLLSMAYKPIKGLGDTPNVIQRALASADKIFAMLDEQPEIEPEPGTGKELLNIKGNVVFDGVSFTYNGEDSVLKGITFEVLPGETVALVGPSGSGKSTIINLLMKYYNPQKGAVYIDGIDIRKVSIKSLRSQIGFVPQETMLFSGTVLENIKYGNLDAGDEEVITAAKAANADMFISNFPDGYQTEIGERGVQISGGQRQRLAIARAILSNPRILVFDEATSSLDSESENLVREAMELLMKNRTSFVIAHRLSTIQSADKILVIDKGVIAQMGNHKELVEQDGIYKNLYQQQYFVNNGTDNR